MSERNPTVFGRVLSELMASRGVSDVGGLHTRAEAAGEALEGGAIDQRMSATGVEIPSMNGLANTLGLSDEERMRLAMAYTFEEDLQP